MALTFPNPSRSYDATRRAVRFWGYDSSMEASFFVSADALKNLLGRAAYGVAGGGRSRSSCASQCAAPEPASARQPPACARTAKHSRGAMPPARPRTAVAISRLHSAQYARDPSAPSARCPG